MLNFEEELKKFKPSLEVEDIDVYKRQYGSREEFEQYGADFIVRTVSELREIL